MGLLLWVPGCFIMVALVRRTRHLPSQHLPLPQILGLGSIRFSNQCFRLESEALLVQAVAVILKAVVALRTMF